VIQAAKIKAEMKRTFVVRLRSPLRQSGLSSPDPQVIARIRPFAVEVQAFPLGMRDAPLPCGRLAGPYGLL